MMIGAKTARGQAPQITRASFNFVHPVAGTTVEMMMMIKVCDLVPRLRSWDIYRGQDVFLDQAFDGSIDGRDSQPWHLFASRVKNFLRREWALGSHNGGADRITLTGVSFDGHV